MRKHFKYEDYVSEQEGFIMEASFRRALESMKVDIGETVGRLMNNEELYLKFVLRYADDKNFSNGRQCYIEQNYGEMERFFHAMKGVTATLGIFMVSSRAEKLVSAIRAKNYEDIPSLLNDLEKANNFVLEQIATIKKDD